MALKRSNIIRFIRQTALTLIGAAAIGSFLGIPSADSAEPKKKPTFEAYRLVVLAADPVGYWRLGETAIAESGADETLHKHTGRYLGKPAFASAGAIAGDSNTSVTFDDKSYLEIPDDPAFSQPTSGKGLTVEVWMRPDKLDFAENESFKYIHWLGKGEAGQHEWGFRFYTQGDKDRSNRISAYIWNPDGKLGAGAYFQDKIVVGEWLHIVACFEPTEGRVTQSPPGVQLFKNGVFRKGPPEKGTLYHNPPEWTIIPRTGTAPLRIGTKDRKSFLIGGLDEVAIYPRVLSTDEIQLHYEVGIGTRKLSATELTKLRNLVKLRK
jgi:hypothetical protein